MSSVSEHCFNLLDAQHRAGTNRYVFKYPGTWHLQHEANDLSIGIRSILLKPASFDVDLNDLYVMGCISISETGGEATITPITPPNPIVSICGDQVKPDWMDLSHTITVNENVDMATYCQKLSNEYKERFDRHERLCYELYLNSKYLGMKGDSFIVKYTNDGSFYMGTTTPNTYLLHVCSGPGTYGDISLFNSSFHTLMGLDETDENQNLNKILHWLLLCSMDSLEETYVEAVLNIRNTVGVCFNEPYINPEYTGDDWMIDDGIYKVDENDHPKYLCDRIYAVEDTDNEGQWFVLFNSLTIRNVWSRKNVLITSSIAENDTRNYLGYSSVVGDHESTYALPKMYDLTNQSNEFWIETFDSHTGEPVEVPIDTTSILIEACLYLKDKRTFNRYENQLIK